MNRRHFLAALAGASAAVPGFGHAGAGQAVTPEQVRQTLSEGRTVFMDVFADWCSTCARQERVINALLEDNPDYAQSVAFLSVDWDLYRSNTLFDELNVPSRSTLLVLKGDEEFGRIVADTSKGTIKNLMDTAVEVAADS
jgi:thiol:disulfide interchange protein